MVVLAALLLLPIMLMLGRPADISAKGEQHARTRHETVATLIVDADAKPGGHRIAATGKSDVRAEWQLPDGSTQTGLVRANKGLKSGAEVEIWLDQGGRVVGPPVSSADAGLAAVMIAAVGWLTVAGLLASCQVGLHHLLNRRRYRSWG
ncbi:MAG: hypothetical protein GEV28_15910 [Actinophytocola sp.]|uniref:Rv1733c family protein n=1 Tax=Actinophytocola sp. TaxID=1872138 RepID=UPI0013229BF7|nr:hypothetical protein [Actinophytocola sp.]MPZ81796.1 hypothetical protein [Actinophytocola sp.]